MKELAINKKSSLVNLSNSILKWFEQPTFHDSLEKVDELLKKSNKKKVSLILLDGFGTVIANYYKENCPFIFSHKFMELETVNPPTTVAATTSLTTGLYPIETGYIGWTQYFKEYDRSINVFLSNDKFTGEKILPPVTLTTLKIENIWDIINKDGKYKANQICSFAFRGQNEIESYNMFFDEADKIVKENNFSYVYSANPDHIMHKEGTMNDIVKENIIYLEEKIKTLVENNKDTLFLLVADHGFHDVIEIPIYEHGDFLETLETKYFTIEGRFACFSVKNKDKFVELANKYYGKDFYIVSKKELLENNILGYGNMKPYAEETLFDYFLIAKGKYIFYDSIEPIGFKGAHAGLTKEERSVTLFAFNCD